MRNLLLYLALAGILLTTSVLSGCTVLASLKPKEYRCNISGQSDPVTAEDYYLRAIDHAELSKTNLTGDFDECAMAALNEALRIDPNHTAALRMRGYGYSQKKKYDLALADIERAIQIEPDKHLNYPVRARIFAATNLLDKAIADQTKAIELIPKDNDQLHYYYSRRADYYIRKKDYQAAVEDYTEAIRLKPDYKYHYSDRAHAYSLLNKYDLAKADDEKAVELDPTHQTSEGSTQLKSISAGRLNDKALSLVKPVYPPAAKAAKVDGHVIVRVSIDVNGNVDSARSVAGHDLLRPAAEAAAMASKFSPGTYNGKPVRMTGTIRFDFTPEDGK
jgi:TonB family protein